MFRFIRKIRENRLHIENEAVALIELYGDPAYFVARSKARAFADSDRKQWKFWSRVAVVIAKKTDYTIGEKVADRYLSNSR